MTGQGDDQTVSSTMDRSAVAFAAQLTVGAVDDQAMVFGAESHATTGLADEFEP